ncbi:hypothetical protein D9M69_562210 [compost metagenome]
MNARQVCDDLLDTLHFCFVATEVPWIDGALVDARRIAFGRNQYQLITGLEQVVSRYAELIEVKTGGVLLAVLERQLVLAGEQHQHLALRRSGGGTSQHRTGKCQRQGGNLGHGDSPNPLKGSISSGRVRRTWGGAASQSAVAVR